MVGTGFRQGRQCEAACLESASYTKLHRMRPAELKSLESNNCVATTQLPFRSLTEISHGSCYLRN